MKIARCSGASSITLRRKYRSMKHMDIAELHRYGAVAQFLKTLTCVFILVISVLSFMYKGLLKGIAEIPTDLHFFYAAGQVWHAGLDVYNRDLFTDWLKQLGGDKALAGGSAYPYPPQGSVLFALLPLISLETAHLVVLSINISLLVIALAMLGSILSWYRPIGLLEITLLASFLNTGFGRGNVRGAQTGLLVCVLLLAIFILVARGRNGWAGLGLGVLSFKPTFLPLYVAYYLLRRSYRLVSLCLVTAAACTLVPLLLTQRPLVATLTNWVRTITMHQGAQHINDPSPFTPYSAQLVNLGPLVYRVLNASSGVATASLALILLIAFSYTAYLIRRTPHTASDSLLDFGLISALSLLSVYHRSYDIFLLFPGLLYIYAHAANAREKAIRQPWLGFVVVAMLLISLPGDMTVNLSNVYPALLDSYAWRVVAPLQAWAGVAVFGALLWLKSRQVYMNESTSM